MILKINKSKGQYQDYYKKLKKGINKNNIENSIKTIAEFD